MRSASFTVAFSVALAAVFCSTAAAQRLAFAWESNDVTDKFVASMASVESSPIKVIDTDLSQTAIRAAIGSKPYNLTADQGKLAATVAGSDFIVFVKAEALRRNSFELGDHYEAWAAVFLVDGRSGTMIEHRLESAKAKTEKDAIVKLNELAPPSIAALIQSINSSKTVSSIIDTNIRTVPSEGTPEAAGFVAPIPFKRIKPEYTSIAYLYSVTATVEIEIDLDETGKVIRTRIVRWAGFGLDESVEKAVRAMQWRPAYFGKTARPIRFVAQYNFRKPQ